jgi:hypothetical protein
MDTVFGLPAHPLLVHIPIVLLPLSAIGVVLMLVRRSWRAQLRWIVLALAIAGTGGAVLAASAGEHLEGRIVAAQGPAAAAAWHDHAELGDVARNVSILYLVAAAAFVLVPWWLDRRATSDAPPGAPASAPSRGTPRWADVTLAVLVVAAAVGTVTTIVYAGHTGSKAVWQGFTNGAGTEHRASPSP